MPKPNAFLMKMEAAYDRKLRRAEDFGRALCQDAAVYTVNEVFRIGQVRMVPFIYEYTNNLHEFADMINGDAHDDREVIYAKAKIDELLRPLYGEWMLPFDERYGIVPLSADRVELTEKQAEQMKKYMAEHHPERSTE
ncbi:MAG: hypothetical protein K6C09_08425 [Oscillospiraceae bacterium]|nr:hypothetical protein [Oscillospiraceae bacterium]